MQLVILQIMNCISFISYIYRTIRSASALFIRFVFIMQCIV